MLPSRSQGQIGLRRPIQAQSLIRESASMNRTIKRHLRRVITDNTFHVGAQGAHFDNLPIFALVDRNGPPECGVQHRARTGDQILNVADVGLQQPLILLVDRHRIRRNGRHGLGERGKPLRRVKLTPGVVLPLDQVGDQLAAEDAMSQSVARISCDDVDVIASGIKPDEGHIVRRLVDLAAPPVIYGTGLGKTVPDPLLEFVRAPVGTLLANPMVASSDDNVVVFIVAHGESDVLSRLSRIVNKAVLDAPLRHPNGNRICAVVLHLRYDAQLL